MGREPQASDIIDEGSMHPFRTEIPNTVVRGMKSRGLSIYAKWLYVYLKSRAGDGGKCTCSTTTIATESGMSRGQVSVAKQELAKHGLITISPGKNPRRHSDQIRIKNIWLLNMQEFGVQDMNTEEDDQGPSSQDVNHPSVHNMNTETDRGKKSVQDMNTLHQQHSVEQARASISSIHNTNTEAQAVFTIRTGCSPYEQGVHHMNQRRSLEEDPIKKQTPPTGEIPRARTKQPSRLRHMPSETDAQDAMKATVMDTQFVAWQTERFPQADRDAQWEHFVNQCLAKGYRYADFRRAFMNSFAWENGPAQRALQTPPRHQNGHRPGGLRANNASEREYRTAQAGVELAQEIMSRGRNRQPSLLQSPHGSGDYV